jgi:hypothetical protein
MAAAIAAAARRVASTVSAAGAACAAVTASVATDSGYWSIANLTTIPDTPELLSPPDRHGQHGKPCKDGKPSAPRSDSLRAAMRAKLDSA